MQLQLFAINKTIKQWYFFFSKIYKSKPTFSIKILQFSLQLNGLHIIPLTFLELWYFFLNKHLKVVDSFNTFKTILHLKSILFFFFITPYSYKNRYKIYFTFFFYIIRMFTSVFHYILYKFALLLLLLAFNTPLLW